MRRRPGRPSLVLLACCAVLGAGAATAQAIPWDAGGAIPPARTPAPARPDPLCRESYANDAPRGGAPLRFGIGPRLAGESGAAQVTAPAPEIPARRDAALRRLQGHRYLAVRLNRLFESDGAAGIAHFQRLAAHFGRMGLDVELQVRYHPRPQDDGNLAVWLAYVRRVVRAFGPNRHVTGLQITNEVNLAVSPNTSDGAHRRAVEALVRGVIAAKRESRRLGFRRQRIGFNYAFRFGDRNDAAFWDAVGRRGGARLRRATDWVGVDLYPGTFVRPSRRSSTSATRCWRGSRWSASATCRRRASGGARRCGSRSWASRPGPAGPTRRRRPAPSTSSSAPRSPTAAPTA